MTGKLKFLAVTIRAGFVIFYLFQEGFFQVNASCPAIIEYADTAVSQFLGNLIFGSVHAHGFQCLG